MGVYGIQKIIVFCDYFGDSNYRIRAQIKIDGNEDLLNAVEAKLGHGTFRNAADFISRVRTIATRERQHQDGNVDVTVTKAAVRDATVDGREHREWNNPRRNNGQSTGDNAKENIEAFVTSQGEVYGFVTGAVGQDEMYLDEDVISPFR